MKFLYEYRTSDNAKHNGVVCCSDRDAAYAELKAKGIKPSRLVEAPGLANKLFGKGKRWIAIVALAAVCVALAVSLGRWRHTARKAEQTLDAFDSPMRRQIIGDAEVIDRGIRTGWSDVFELDGERFLASFAVPGYPAAIRDTTEDALQKALVHDSAVSAAAGGLEARQIIAVVEGMKSELREFVAAGGTIRRYGVRLVQRQEEELAYYRRAKEDVDRARREKRGDAVVSEITQKHNAALRKMGIKLLVLPE